MGYNAAYDRGEERRNLMADLKELTILIRGAGEMASGVAHRLWRCRFKLLLTEIPTPLAVRRAVSFCEAVHDGTKTVEGATAQRVESLEEAGEAWRRDLIPVLVDPEMSCLAELRPQVLVEASLHKRNDFGLRADLTPLVIALGPGFRAPAEADYVIETNRGHNLARVIEEGPAEPDTGQPGSIEGLTWQRVLRAPAEGVFRAEHTIGDLVEKGQAVAQVAGSPVLAGTGGMIRGLIRPGTLVREGLKVGDVDPRGKRALPANISEKARALSGSVLECILRTFNT